MTSKAKSKITCIIITCIVTIVTINMLKAYFPLIKTSNLIIICSVICSSGKSVQFNYL